MAEFFLNYKHMFEDPNDEQYISQLKTLNHVVEQSRRERINSEKKRLLQQAVDYSSLTTVFAQSSVPNKATNDVKMNMFDPNSPNLFNSHNIDSLLRVPFIQNQSNEKLSFSKNGSLGGLLKQNQSGPDEGKTSALTRKQQLVQYQQKQAQEALLKNYRSAMGNKNQGVSSLILGQSDPSGEDNSMTQPRRRNNKGIQEIPEIEDFNIFQDPMKVPKLRTIMLSESMNFKDELDHFQEEVSTKSKHPQKQNFNNNNSNHNNGQSQNQRNNQNDKNQANSKNNIFGGMLDQEQNVPSTVNKKKKTFEAAGQSSISLEEQKKNRIQENYNSLVLKEAAQQEEYFQDSNNDISLEVESIPSTLIYEKLKAELQVKQRLVKRLQEDNQRNNQSNEPIHQIAAIHKGLDKYQNFKRSMGKITYTPDPQSQAAINATPIERRFIASRHLQVSYQI